MIYHGIDMVETVRIRRAVERYGSRFLRRVFTPGELADCAAESDAPRYGSLAARWAAKEAVAKALGSGLSGLGAAAFDDAGRRRPGFQDIEVVRAADGRPILQLRGPAAEIAAALRIGPPALSISHTADHAIASVVALGM